MEQKNYQSAKGLRQVLHQHPEPSEMEVKTKQLLMDFVSEHTTLELFDKGKWFYGLHREEGATQTIGFRADFDAIVGDDGVAFHGCGHDGHAATLAGFALELEGKSFGKNIVLLFQHAEENGAGARQCVGVIEEQHIEAFFAQHNFPGCKKGVYYTKPDTYFCASKGMSIFFNGRQSHASLPEEGINPVYLISELVNRLEPLSTFRGYTPFRWEEVDFQSMVLCTIVHCMVGKKAFGVSPSRGELHLTLRAEKQEDLLLLQHTLERIIIEQSKKRALECTFSYQDEFAQTANDPVLTRKMIEVVRSYGQEIIVQEEPYRTSEDFGEISSKVPSCFFVIGDGEDYAPIHSVGFDFPDENIPLGVDLFLMIARSNF